MATSYCSYDAATGAYTQQTHEEFCASLTAEIQRALVPFLGEPPKPKSLREIQAEEEEVKRNAELAAQQRAAAVEAAKRQAEWQAEQEAAAKEAELARHRALGHKRCWCCEEKGIEAYHACKENICPTATTGYTRFDKWGNPNTAYPAHPLREYYSSPGMPSHSNNFYKRAFREYDEETARERARAARALKKAEDATGLMGEEAKEAYKRILHAPKHGLGNFLIEETVAPKSVKKSNKKQTVEKFSLDQI